ncbi:hypothetical protein OKW26_006298 [Paraburkholderia sp. 32]
MHPKRFLAASLSIAHRDAAGRARAIDGRGGHRAGNVIVEAPLVSGPSDAHADPILPPDIARGVFGTYGGAQSRFSNGGGSGGTGGKTGSNDWRAPIVAQKLPDLGSGGAGSLSPQAERKLGERVMREIRRDPDYLDDWLVRDYLNSVAVKLAAAAAASGPRVRLRAGALASVAGPVAQRIRGRDFAIALGNRGPHRAERRGELVRHRLRADAARALRRRGGLARERARDVRLGRACTRWRADTSRSGSTRKGKVDVNARRCARQTCAAGLATKPKRAAT